jgi:general secretion pathway protein L
MSEILVIRLLGSVNSATPAETPAQWLLVDTHGARLGTVLQGRLGDAAMLAQGRKVVGLVPGTDTLSLNPALPALKGNTKLSQVVPYALEDQLAVDIDELYFAIGKRGKSANTPVIVVAHQLMKDWVSALTAAGAQPDALNTDTSLLPTTTEGLTVLIDQGRVSIKQSDSSVSTLDVSPLSEALQLLIPATNQSVTIFITEQEYQAEKAAIDALFERAPNVALKLLPDGVLPLLALQTTQPHAINLLQGEYTQRKKTQYSFGGWKVAAGLLIALIGLHLFSKSLELWQLSKQEAELDQQIQTIYSQTLSVNTPVKADKARPALQTRWQQLQELRKPNHLMKTLDVLSKVTNAKDALKIQELNYNQGTVQLKVLAPNDQSLDYIQRQAKTQGITAELQGTTAVDEKVEGQISFQSPSGV